jgi:hypothetical protein
MRGPLPNPQHRRRNAPSIPTTRLPSKGRPGAPPKPPKWVELGKAGAAWWAWAWKTPQAAAWNDGHLVAVARRAGLEDDLAALRQVQGLDVAELLDVEADEWTDLLEALLRTLAALASKKLAVARECRELDDRLGLTPKAFSQLRWSIEEPAEPAGSEKRSSGASNVRRLRAVDPDAVAGA